MRIEIRGRNTPGHRRPPAARGGALHGALGKQVSDLAQLEVELMEERIPRSRRKVAEATLHLKGVTLRAREASPT